MSCFANHRKSGASSSKAAEEQVDTQGEQEQEEETPSNGESAAAQSAQHAWSGYEGYYGYYPSPHYYPYPTTSTGDHVTGSTTPATASPSTKKVVSKKKKSTSAVALPSSYDPSYAGYYPYTHQQVTGLCYTQ